MQRLKRNAYLVLVCVGCLMSLSFVSGQSHDAASQGQPPAPPKVWSGSLGAGFSLTGGNTDTATYNISFDLLRDPKTRNIMKFTGLYLRADADDSTISDRLGLNFRDEYTLSGKTFLYGDFGYLRDPFKEIDYLLNPQAGIGHKLYETDRAAFSINGGAGAVWEKNPGFTTRSDGSVNAGQDFSLKLSEGTALSQTISALWKMQDFGDALYHFGIGLSTTIFKQAELKVEFIDDYKARPPRPEIKKNDTAFLTSFLFKF